MKRSLTVIALIVASVAGGGVWYVQSKLPTRQGQVELPTLQEPVTVRYDERGVPHIRAGNQLDMYRALHLPGRSRWPAGAGMARPEGSRPR